MGKIMKDGIQYGVGGIQKAESITYDNTDSGMTATNVQGAVDELNNGLIVVGAMIPAVFSLAATGWKTTEITSPTMVGYTLIGYLVSSSTYRIVGGSYQIASNGRTAVFANVTATVSANGTINLIPLFKKD